MGDRIGYICRACSKQWGNWASDSHREVVTCIRCTDSGKDPAKDAYRAAIDELAAAKAEAARYRKALEWYADPKTHKLDEMNGDPTRAFIPIIDDNGNVARAALAEGGGG